MPRAFTLDRIMPWGGELRRTCKICQRLREDGETFSARGLCRDCGTERATESAVQLAMHDGPYFERWRHAVAASVGGLIMDTRSSGD